MKITIYELLGLVKDNKAPKKIKYKGQEYTFFKDDETTDYIFKIDNRINDWLSTSIGNRYISDMFTNTVEIIEESKKIKKIDFRTLNTQKEKNRVMKDTINELIDEINNLKEK